MKSKVVKALLIAQIATFTLTGLQKSFIQTASEQIKKKTSKNSCDIKQSFFFNNDSNDINIDFNNPVYTDGVFSTSTGGVITTSDMRIQAKEISFTKNAKESFLSASGNLMVLYDDMIFVGEKLYYDFKKKEGVILSAKGGIAPWYFGGKTVKLLPNGNWEIYQGYLTTSARKNPKWKIATKKALLQNQCFLYADHISAWAGPLPFLYFPKLYTNLNFIKDAPLRYRIRLGGKEGPRFGVIYEFFSTKNFKSYIRFDWRTEKGVAGGFETDYLSNDKLEHFWMENYFSNEPSPILPDQKKRYRFRGTYSNYKFQDSFNIEWSYDIVSDKFMVTDYYENGLKLKSSEPTELNIHKTSTFWTANLYSRIRVNPFQSVKQELPTFAFSFLPFVLGKSNIITSTDCKMSYLDFRISKDLSKENNPDPNSNSDPNPDPNPELAKGYTSPRLEINNIQYLPLSLGALTLTPYAGFTGIYYGDSPNNCPQSLIIGSFGYTLNTALYAYYSSYKHVIEPYLIYKYLTLPNVNLNDHYLFDINDGWYRVNYLRFGLKNLIYQKGGNQIVYKTFKADIYANAFFHTPTVPKTIPYIYSEVLWNVTPFMRIIFNNAWDTTRIQWNHFNIRVNWTIDKSFAFCTEYRHRSKYAWRKANFENYILESFHFEQGLLSSPLSDKRDTLLIHAFKQVTPSLAFELKSRIGWNRKKPNNNNSNNNNNNNNNNSNNNNEPNYHEWGANIHQSLSGGWRALYSFQRLEYDTRFSFHLSLMM